MTLIVYNILNKRRYLQNSIIPNLSISENHAGISQTRYKVELDVMASGWFHIIQMSYKYFQNYIILSYM